MDVEATRDAIKLLRGGSVGHQFIGRERMDTIGSRILDSAIYHLERGLYDYLTGRSK